MEYLYIIICIIILIKVFCNLIKSYKIKEKFTNVSIDNTTWNNRFKKINEYIYELQNNLKNYSDKIILKNSIDGIDEIIVDELNVPTGVNIKKTDDNTIYECLEKIKKRIVSDKNIINSRLNKCDDYKIPIINCMNKYTGKGSEDIWNDTEYAFYGTTGQNYKKEIRKLKNKNNYPCISTKNNAFLDLLFPKENFPYNDNYQQLRDIMCPGDSRFANELSKETRKACGNTVWQKDLCAHASSVKWRNGYKIEAKVTSPNLNTVKICNIGETLDKSCKSTPCYDLTKIKRKRIGDRFDYKYGSDNSYTATGNIHRLKTEYNKTYDAGVPSDLHIGAFYKFGTKSYSGSGQVCENTGKLKYTNQLNPTEAC